MTTPTACPCGAPTACYPYSDPTVCSFHADGYHWCAACTNHHAGGVCLRPPASSQEPA